MTVFPIVYGFALCVGNTFRTLYKGAIICVYMTVFPIVYGFVLYVGNTP
jgi:hypothetical protein